jgi:hypothetical protein
VVKPIMDSIAAWSPEYSRIWNDDMNNGDPNRADQAEAEYTDNASGSNTCKGCVYFQPRTVSGLGTCIKVKGVISENGHSRYFADAHTGVIENKETEGGEGV